MGGKDFFATHNRSAMEPMSRECVKAKTCSIITVYIDNVSSVSVLKVGQIPIKCCTPMIVRVVPELKTFSCTT